MCSSNHTIFPQITNNMQHREAPSITILAVLLHVKTSKNWWPVLTIIKQIGTTWSSARRVVVVARFIWCHENEIKEKRSGIRKDNESRKENERTRTKNENKMQNKQRHQELNDEELRLVELIRKRKAQSNLYSHINPNRKHLQKRQGL